MKKDKESQEELVRLVREIGAEVFEALYFKIREEISDFLEEHRSKK